MRNKKVTVTGANILFFIFAVSFLFIQVFIGFVSAFLRENIIEDNMYLMLFINEYILILLPVIIFALAKKLDFKEVFRFRKVKVLPSLLVIAISVPAYFVAAMLNTFVVYLLQYIGKVPATTIPVPQNVSELVLGLIMIAVTPAICEEMLNRGIMLKAYENRGAMKAVIITAIFFGIFHFDITNFLGPVFLGLLIGYYTIRTNSIFAAMLAHFLNNAFAEVTSYIYRNDINETSYMAITAEDLGVTILYGIAGLIIISVLIRIFKKQTEETAVTKPSISSAGKDAQAIFTHWPVVIVLSLYALLALMYIAVIAISSISMY